MKYKETAEKLAEYRSQIAGIREKMRSAQASIEPEEVHDYEFATPQGKAQLSALFGDKDTLFLVHNMGTTCAHCTMWADGFNGVFDHFRDRAAFAVSSPDTPERQQSFAAGRGWKFPMVSIQGTRVTRSCEWRIRPSRMVMISAVSGTFLIYFRKASPVGNRNSATQAE